MITEEGLSRYLEAVEKNAAAADPHGWPNGTVKDLARSLRAARAELERLQQTDPHRIARVAQEALEEERAEWRERSRDSALALEECARQLAVRAALLMECGEAFGWLNEDASHSLTAERLEYLLQRIEAELKDV